VPDFFQGDIMTEEDFAKFKKLCDEKGIRFKSDAEAKDSAYKLLNLMRIVVKNPFHSEKS
jgi:hypothetical protein